jgi:hypothetical protein
MKDTHGPTHDRVSSRQPKRVHLPGFVNDREIGLGDAIKRATSAIGIAPCGSCERRAASLNRRLIFSPWHVER